MADASTSASTATDTFKETLKYILIFVSIIYTVIIITCYTQSYGMRTAYNLGDMKQKYCYPAYLVSETGNYEASQKMDAAADKILYMRYISLTVNTCISAFFIIMLIVINYRTSDGTNPLLNFKNVQKSSIKGYIVMIMMLIVFAGSIIIPISLLSSETKSYTNPSLNIALPNISIICCVLALILIYIAVPEKTNVPNYRSEAALFGLAIIVFTIIANILNSIWVKIKQAKMAYDTNTFTLQNSLAVYKLSDADAADLATFPADSDTKKKHDLVLKYIAVNVNDAERTAYSPAELPNNPYRNSDTWKYIMNANGSELASIFPETNPDPSASYVNANIGVKTPDGFTALATIRAQDVSLGSVVQPGYKPMFVYQGKNVSATNPAIENYINLVYGSSSTAYTNSLSKIGISSNNTHIRINNYIFKLKDANTTKGSMVYMTSPPPSSDASAYTPKYKDIISNIEAPIIETGTFDTSHTNVPYIDVAGYNVSTGIYSWSVILPSSFADTIAQEFWILLVKTLPQSSGTLRNLDGMFMQNIYNCPHNNNIYNYSDNIRTYSIDSNTYAILIYSPITTIPIINDNSTNSNDMYMFLQNSSTVIIGTIPVRITR